MLENKDLIPLATVASFVLAIIFGVRTLWLRRLKRRLEGVAQEVSASIAAPVNGLAKASVGLADSLVGMINGRLFAMRDLIALAACWEKAIPLLCLGQFSASAEMIATHAYVKKMGLMKNLVKAVYDSAIAAKSVDAELIAAAYPFVHDEMPPLQVPDLSELEKAA
jgi:hypothetical protein